MWPGKDMFCCCGFKTDSGNKMAKHLATSGCSTAYPDAETANKALRGGSSGGGGPTSLAHTAKPAGGDGDVDEITSYDPSEEMAKAYMKEDKGGAGRSEPEGPLTFLGLQQKKDEEREVDDDTKEAQNDDCEGSKKDGDPKDSKDSSTRVGSVSGVNGSEVNRGDEEATSAVEDQEVADKASAETEVTESQETSRSEIEVGAKAMDASDTATKEPGEQGKGPAPPAASGPAELLSQEDLVVEAEAVFSQESAPAAETNAQDAPQAGEAETTAATAEDTSSSLAAATMDTE